MRIFKSKMFNKWANKESVSDLDLHQAVCEIVSGLVDANLGGFVYKKRVAIGGKGKSGGVRTLLAFRQGKSIFFVYGFAKKVRANIKPDELKALKLYAAKLMALSDSELDRALLNGVLIEVKKR